MCPGIRRPLPITDDTELLVRRVVDFRRAEVRAAAAAFGITVAVPQHNIVSVLYCFNCIRVVCTNVNTHKKTSPHSSPAQTLCACQKLPKMFLLLLECTDSANGQDETSLPCRWVFCQVHRGLLSTLLTKLSEKMRPRKDELKLLALRCT